MNTLQIGGKGLRNFTNKDTPNILWLLILALINAFNRHPNKINLDFKLKYNRLYL